MSLYRSRYFATTGAISSTGTPRMGKETSNGGPMIERTASSVGGSYPYSANAYCSERAMPGSELEIVPSKSTRTWVRLMNCGVG